LQAGLNPAISGVVGGLALTESLLGSVINRPSSPFVASLATDDGKPCGVGTWARGTGGKANASGTTTSDLGNFSNTFNVTYRGLQAGLDHACFGGHYGGWDLSFGATLGTNTGSSTQPVLSYEPGLTGVLEPGSAISINRTKFQQLYGGAYVTASRGRLFGDLQMRASRTEFDLTNIALPNGSALGVKDQRYTSNGQTLSGSLGYAFTLNESAGLSLVPTLGFSFSSTKVGSLVFDKNGDTTNDGILDIDRVKSRIGFASVSLVRSRVLPDNRSGITMFGTATLYNDFAKGTKASYFDLDTNGVPTTTGLESVSNNLGSYGEFSLGLNYTRLLTPGQARARQLDTSVRLDGRKGKNIESWGLTAQLRLQF